MDTSVLHEPLYTTAEAARLAEMTADRVRRWLRGYQYEWGKPGQRKSGRQPPVVSRSTPHETAVSFLDLMELLFAKAFLERGISLNRVRRALEEAQNYIQEDHPFARRRFLTWGSEIYLDLQDTDNSTLLHLLHSGQTAIRPIILSLAERIDFDPATDLASAWWPLGRKKRVIIQPEVSFGAPTVVGRGIRTSNIFDLYAAENGDIKKVCFWLNLKPAEVRAAVEFEERLLKAA